MELHTITGPPGTGKTTTVATRIAAHIEEGVSRDKILVASLTRAAAQEAARVAPLSSRQVGTWHAFAYHALGEPQLTEAHIKDWNASCAPAWRLSGEANGSGEGPYLRAQDCATGDRLMLTYSRLRSACVDRQGGGWPLELQRFAAAWDDWKAQCGYADFNDIVERACDLDAAPGRPDIIYCDEAQDLSLAEARLIERWSRSVDLLCLAGDDHQAIYGWRGSDPIAVRDVWASMDGVAHRRHDNLEQSYRVSRAVHNVAMRQMRRCQLLRPVEYAPRDELGDAARAPSMSPAGHLAVKHGLRHANEGETVMFIASCGYMLKAVMQALTTLGEVWHNPWRPAARAWNPMQASKGVSFYERCLAFMRPRADIFGEEARFWTVEDLQAWVSPLPVKGILKPNAKTQISSLPKNTPAETVAQRMRDWFESEALIWITVCNLRWYLHSMSSGKQTTASHILKALVEHRGETLVAQAPRVVVGTVHSLKGAEADVVYVCPDISSAAMRAATDPRIKEELLRVFYVAITRARRALYLCAPSSNMFMAI